MILVKKNEGTPYDAPKHVNVWSTKKLAVDKDSQRLSVSVSHFLPNGSLEMSGGPAEKVYYVLAGSMHVTTKTGEATLQAGDMIFFASNEERSIKVIGNDVLSILVVLGKI